MKEAVLKLLATRAYMLACAALLFMLASAVAQAQEPARLELATLDRLEPRAEQTLNITMDGKVLQLALRFLSDKKPNEAKIKEAVAGIRGIYVKRFEFDQDNVFSAADVEPIRSQLRSPLWSQLVEVRSKKEGQNIDVFTMIDGGKINGVAIIALDRRQVTVVNIIGPVDVDKLTELRGNFGIPDFNIGK
ncbi:MAG: DUF4252 domain-containing protein [Pyrinomonadaceae bacterium]|nr:DUF4252 domain-containing protein [Pyrinomonadaceae bacterium]